MSQTGMQAVLEAATSVPKADHDAALLAAANQAKASQDKAVAEATAAATQVGATAERERVKAILGHDNAKGREGFAHVYAFETNMTAEAATAALAGKPKLEAQKGSLLDGRVPNPQIAIEAGTIGAVANDHDAGRAAVLALKGKRPAA